MGRRSPLEKERDPLDPVFRALADQHRRKILDVLRDQPGVNLATLTEHFAMSRIGVMKHLAILESAGLVLSRKVGREKRLYLNALPLQAIADRWVSEFGQAWARGLDDWKRSLEAETQGSNSNDGPGSHRIVPNHDRSPAREGLGGSDGHEHDPPLLHGHTSRRKPRTG